MIRGVLLILLALSLATAPPGYSFQSEDLVDCPTSGLSPWGTYELGIRLEPEGGVIARAGISLLDRILFRASYGGKGIIGYGSPEWNPRPEVEGRFRLLEEMSFLPAFSLGFVSQGYGGYEGNRYRFKSKGFYGVVSKTLTHLQRLDLHVGGNYTLEGTDEDPDLFFGVEQYLNADFSVLGDFSMGWNDDEEAGFGEGEGYLNLGVRWIFGGRMAMEFSLRNLTQNGEDGVNRTAKVAYVDYF